MLEKINVFSALKIKNFLMVANLIFLFLFSCYSWSASTKGFKPACLEYCDSIKEIGFIMVDKTNDNIVSRKSIFLDKMNLVLSKNGAKDRISVVFVKLNDPLVVHQIQSYRVVIEISFYDQIHDSSFVEFDLKVVFPNEVYFKRLTCNVSKNLSCIDAELDRLAEKIVGDYLFKPVMVEVKN